MGGEGLEEHGLITDAAMRVAAVRLGTLSDEHFAQCVANQPTTASVSFTDPIQILSTARLYRSYRTPLRRALLCSSSLELLFARCGQTGD